MRLVIDGLKRLTIRAVLVVAYVVEISLISAGSDYRIRSTYKYLQLG